MHIKIVAKVSCALVAAVWDFHVVSIAVSIALPDPPHCSRDATLFAREQLFLMRLPRPSSHGPPEYGCGSAAAASVWAGLKRWSSS